MPDRRSISWKGRHHSSCRSSSSFSQSTSSLLDHVRVRCCGRGVRRQSQSIPDSRRLPQKAPYFHCSSVLCPCSCLCRDHTLQQGVVANDEARTRSSLSLSLSRLVVDLSIRFRIPLRLSRPLSRQHKVNVCIKRMLASTISYIPLLRSKFKSSCPRQGRSCRLHDRM